MSNSLYNPFLFSAFLDRRTFKEDGPSNNNNDDKPSPAPAPTTFYNDYSDPDNPVLDTMSAVEDRRSGDGSTSSAYAIANDKNFTPASTPAARTEAEVQADINAELDASGGEWNSNLNDLVSERTEIRSGGGGGGGGSSSAPATTPAAVDTGLGSFRPVARPTNLLSSQEQALVDAYNAVPEDDESYTPDSATMAAVLKSQDKESVIPDPLSVADQVASYGGADLDAQDEATTAVNNAAAATAFENSDFDYTVDTGAGRNLDADLGVGGSSATVSAADLAAFQNEVGPIGRSYGDDAIEYGNIAAIPLDGGGNLLVNDSSDIYDKINADAAAAVDSRSVFEKAQDAFFDDRDETSRAVSDAAGNLLNASGAVNPYGSPLPDSSQVAGGDWEEYFKNASTQDILDLAGSNVTLPVTPDATPSYDAFGNEYATAEQAAAADIAAEAAASNYGTMSQQDFVDEYATDDAAGISDALKYVAIVGPENVGNMFSGMGSQSQITSPLNILPTTGREVGINALIPYMTNEFGKLFMSEEDKRARMLAADPNRPASLTSQAMQDFGGYLSGTVSPYIRDYLQPESGQAVFEGDFGGPLTVTDLSGNQLTGPQATQGIVNTTAGEVSDTALDLALNANPITRTISAALNAGEQLTGLEQGISSNVDEAYVSGALDNNATFQEALKAQGGDVDKALGVIKDLAYVSGDVPAYQQVAASGVVDAVLPKVGKGILGFGKEIAKRGAVEGGQGAFESYAAINAINQALGTDFDPTKNIVGAAATEGVAGTGAATVGSAVAQGLSARQRRNAADEEALMSQPVVAPYGGMDTSGITPGFNKARSPGSAGSPGTIEGQFTVFDPNISPTAGDPASSTVPSAYDLEGPEAALAITDQRDPMTTSMETMAAQEIINDQVSQTGTVDFGILQRIQNATGLSMNELGSMVDSATSTKLTPDEIAAIESAPVGDVMTNAPVAPGFDDEVTGNFGGSNISVKPNADGTTTLTAPSGRISVVEPGQDLDQAIKVFDEIVTPVDVQTDVSTLQDPGQGLAAPDLSAAPFASTNTGGISTLGTPSGVGTAPVVDTAAPGTGSLDAASAPVKTFTTAKGSTYDAFGDGTTVRNRAERTKFGRPDGEVSGVQPRSQQTVFMTKEAANEIGPLFQNTEVATELVIEGDKARLVLKEDVGPRKAGSDYSKTVTLSTEPEVGLQPVEIMDTSNDNSRNIHFGSEITEVSSVDADQAITNKMDADNTFEEVSDAQAVANAEAIKAQEVAYTETKAATGDDAAAEAAGEAAYNSSIAASSVSKTDDGGAEVEIADNLFEAANKADQDVVTVNADGTATVAVDPNAVATGTDVAVVPETTTDVTTNADGTTDVVIDGTTDLTTAATTDLTVDGDTDTDTDTTAVTVVDNTIDGTATEISGALTDQTQDTKTSVVPVVDNDITMLTEIEPPDEEVEVDEPVVTADPVTVDPDVPDIFVPPITTTDENGDTVIECQEGYVQVETEDGPMCQKIITARSSIQRGGRFIKNQGKGYTGRVASLSSGSKGPGQKRKTRTTSRTERVRPTVRT